MESLAEKLISKYHTRNPFEIAQCLRYIVIRTPLYGIRGFYEYCKRHHIIYVDNCLDEMQQNFVCAHELGHSLLHRKINRIFMETKTRLVTSRYEKEADRFAVELIFSDDDFLPFRDYPIERAAQYFGIDISLAEYRMSLIHENETEADEEILPLRDGNYYRNLLKRTVSHITFSKSYMTIDCLSEADAKQTLQALGINPDQ